MEIKKAKTAKAELESEMEILINQFMKSYHINEVSIYVNSNFLEADGREKKFQFAKVEISASI